MNSIKYETMILFGIIEKPKLVNFYFVNFMLSVARFCIFKRRNLKMCGEGFVDIKPFFRFTIKKFINYSFNYYHSQLQNVALFSKYFENFNQFVNVFGSELKILL